MITEFLGHLTPVQHLYYKYGRTGAREGVTLAYLKLMARHCQGRKEGRESRDKNRDDDSWV
jgi:hypothetical protein